MRKALPPGMEAADDALAVLATCALPYQYPRQDRHASILTDPPGRFTGNPALTVHSYGAGRAVYAAAPLEAETHDSQRAVFINILRFLHPTPFCVEMDTHPAVEATRFDQPEQNRTLIHLLNYQQELPNLPVYSIPVILALGGREVAGITALNLGQSIPFTTGEGTGDGGIRFTLPVLKNYEIVVIEYAPNKTAF